MSAIVRVNALDKFGVGGLLDGSIPMDERKALADIGVRGNF